MLTLEILRSAQNDTKKVTLSEAKGHFLVVASDQYCYFKDPRAN
jgi:hypothetical protein